MFTMQNSAAGSEVIFGTDLTPLEIPTVPILNVMNVPGANPAANGGGDCPPPPFVL
jgi:hypothetical protein